MKFKKIAAISLLLFAILANSGCASMPFFDDTTDAADTTAVGTEPTETAEPETTDARLAPLYEEIVDGGFSAGMAFIGYISEEATDSDIRGYIKNSPYADKYDFLEEAPVANAGGTELYAVVTVSKSCRASVYGAKINEAGEYDVTTDSPLYEGTGSDCILLRCNFSDIHSNAVVSFVSGDEIFNVFPMLSGMDGKLAAENCYDFSIYTDTSAPEDKNVQIARELLSDADEVSRRMADGMSLIYTGEHQVIDGRDCMIFALGTDREDQFVREYYYGVCDNLIYTYDAISDAWSVLGAN